MAAKDTSATLDKYFAFISYSHADEKWGSWLHKRLERYRVPKRLVETTGRDGPVAKRMFPIFRDREELPTSADLGATIQDALQKSSYLIVLCSTRSAASRWVNEEILSFKRLGRSNRILCLIIDGEPGASDMPGREAEECFPPAVRFKLGEDGLLSDIPEEPIAADARPGKDGRRNAFLKLAAGVLGVDYDSLKQRDAAQRRKVRLLWATVTVAAVAAAGFGLHTIENTRWESLRQESIALASEAQEALTKGDTRQGMELALAALPQTSDLSDRPVTAQATAALRRAVGTLRSLGVRKAPDYDQPKKMQVLPSGDVLIADQSAGFMVLDGTTGAELRRHVPSEPVNDWALSPDANTYWAVEHGPETQRSDKTWFAPLRFFDIDSATGKVTHEAKIETDAVDRGWSMISPDGRFLVKDVSRNGNSFLRVWDRYGTEVWDTSGPAFSTISDGRFLTPTRLLVTATPPEVDPKALNSDGTARTGPPGPGTFVVDLDTHQLTVIRDPSDAYVCPAISRIRDFPPPQPFLGKGPAPLMVMPVVGTGQLLKIADGGRAAVGVPAGTRGSWCILRWQTDDAGDPAVTFELVNAKQIGQVFEQLPAQFEPGDFQPPEVFQAWFQQLIAFNTQATGHEKCPDGRIFVRNNNTTLCGEHSLLLVQGEGDETSVRTPLNGHTATVRLLALKDDGERGYSLSRDGTIRAWDTGASHSVLPFTHPRGVRTSSGSNRMIVFHGEQLMFTVVEQDGQVVGPPVEASTDAYIAYQLLAGGEVLALFSWERWYFGSDTEPRNFLRLVRVKDGVELARFDGLTGRDGGQPLLSGDGARGAVVQRDGTVTVFMSADGTPVTTLAVPDHQILDAAFTNGGIFAVASDKTADPQKRQLSLFHFATTNSAVEKIQSWKAQNGELLASPDGSRLLINLERVPPDGSLQLLLNPADDELIEVKGFGDDIFASVFSNDGQRLIIAQTGRAITAIDTSTGLAVATGPAQSGAGNVPQIDPAGRFAVATPADALALIPLQEETAPCGNLQGIKADNVAISPTGSYLAVADSWENQVTVYALDACAPVAVLPVDPISAWDMAFKADEALVVIHEQLVTSWPLYTSLEAAMTRARELLERPIFGAESAAPLAAKGTRNKAWPPSQDRHFEITNTSPRTGDH